MTRFGPAIPLVLCWTLGESRASAQTPAQPLLVAADPADPPADPADPVAPALPAPCYPRVVAPLLQDDSPCDAGQEKRNGPACRHARCLFPPCASIF